MNEEFEDDDWTRGRVPSFDQEESDKSITSELLVANLQVDQQRRTRLPFHLLLLPLFPFLLLFFFFALSSHFRTLPLPDNRLSEERKKIKRNEEEANTKWSIVVREIVTSVLSSF